MKHKVEWFSFIVTLCCLSACDFENPFLDPLSYTVTFDAYDWAPGISSATCMPGDTVAMPNPDPEREGYFFGGWYTEKDGHGTQFTAGTAVNDNIKVYARWIKEADAVWVTFDADGGQPVPDAIVRARGETTALPSTNPAKEGVVFEGWYTAKGGGGTQFTDKTQIPADITVYAKWVRYWQVTFDAEGGKPATTSVSCADGFTVKLPSDPTRAEYAFDGWYTDKDGGGKQFTASTPVTENITVYAKWKPYLEVTFDADGGSPTSTKTCAPGTTVRLPAAPTLAEHVFAGWYTDKAGGGKQFTASTPVTEDIIVYAKWKPYLEVTFDADGGSPTTTKRVPLPGATVALPSEPTRDDYVFYGWYTAPNGGGVQFTASTPVTVDLTLYAKWIAKPLALTVTFDAEGGTPTPAPMMCIKDETLKLPAAPTRTEYAFAGWYTAPNGGGVQFTASTPVTANMTVYAKWTPYLVVTFSADDGEPASTTASCAPGSTVKLPSKPTRTEYDFAGWYTAPNGGGVQFTASTPVTANMTVYAKWTPYPVVTFDTNYGVPAISPVSCSSGATIALPRPSPTRDGYVFGGWYMDKEGRGAPFTASTPVTENITVYAKWLKNLIMNGTLISGSGNIRFVNSASMSIQKGAALTIVLSGSNVDWSGARWEIQVEAEPVSVTGSGTSRTWAVPIDKGNGQYTVTAMVWIGSMLYVGNFRILITN